MLISAGFADRLVTMAFMECPEFGGRASDRATKAKEQEIDAAKAEILDLKTDKPLQRLERPKPLVSICYRLVAER